VVEYILNTLSKIFTKHLAVLDGKCSIVTKLEPREEVTKNGKPFTNITSATNIMYLCSCTQTRGICTYFDSNAFRFCPSRSPPKISEIRTKHSDRVVNVLHGNRTIGQ
jgi:hypothetical protein